MDIIYKTFNTKNPASSEVFENVFSLLSASFPPIETRTKENQRNLLYDKRYNILGAFCENELIGFIAFWNLNGFSFLEHFAVKSNIRGLGIGGKILEYAKENLPSPLILEVEPISFSSNAQRRIHFYQRHGFCLNDYKYFQPPLREGSENLPLQIMSSPLPLKETEFNDVKNVLYAQIYDFFE